MKLVHALPPNVFQVIVLPNTGLQICRGFEVTGTVRGNLDAVWRAALRTADRQGKIETLRLIREHIACLSKERQPTGCLQGEPELVKLRTTGLDLEPIRQMIEFVIGQVDATMSPYRSDSALSHFNAEPSTDWQAMPPALCTVVDASLGIARLSRGAS